MPAEKRPHTGRDTARPPSAKKSWLRDSHDACLCVAVEQQIPAERLLVESAFGEQGEVRSSRAEATDRLPPFGCDREGKRWERSQADACCDFAAAAASDRRGRAKRSRDARIDGVGEARASLASSERPAAGERAGARSPAPERPCAELHAVEMLLRNEGRQTGRRGRALPRRFGDRPASDLRQVPFHERRNRRVKIRPGFHALLDRFRRRERHGHVAGRGRRRIIVYRDVNGPRPRNQLFLKIDPFRRFS